MPADSDATLASQRATFGTQVATGFKCLDGACILLCLEASSALVTTLDSKDQVSKSNTLVRPLRGLVLKFISLVVNSTTRPGSACPRDQNELG